jgi:hypothetical protein
VVSKPVREFVFTRVPLDTLRENQPFRKKRYCLQSAAGAALLNWLWLDAEADAESRKCF